MNPVLGPTTVYFWNFSSSFVGLGGSWLRTSATRPLASRTSSISVSVAAAAAESPPLSMSACLMSPMWLLGFSVTTIWYPPSGSSPRKMRLKFEFIVDIITSANITSEIMAMVMPVRNLFASGYATAVRIDGTRLEKPPPKRVTRPSMRSAL